MYAVVVFCWCVVRARNRRVYEEFTAIHHWLRRVDRSLSGWVWGRRWGRGCPKTCIASSAALNQRWHERNRTHSYVCEHHVHRKRDKFIVATAGNIGLRQVGGKMFRRRREWWRGWWQHRWRRGWRRGTHFFRYTIDPIVGKQQRGSTEAPRRALKYSRHRTHRGGVCASGVTRRCTRIPRFATTARRWRDWRRRWWELWWWR